MKKSKIENLEQDLLENALNFICEAVKEAAKVENDHSRLKYVMLHLNAGIQLIFKVRLLEEHWSLVFTEVGKANRSHLKNGDFLSVIFLTKQLKGSRVFAGSPSVIKILRNWTLFVKKEISLSTLKYPRMQML